jgi:hypothetical protein
MSAPCATVGGPNSGRPTVGSVLVGIWEGKSALLPATLRLRMGGELRDRQCRATLQLGMGGVWSTKSGWPTQRTQHSYHP